MNINDAVRLLNAYETWQPAYGQSAGDKQNFFDASTVNEASRILNDYAMKGGDVSGIPTSLQKYTTPEYADFIASRGSGQFRHALPLLATLGGGLAGVAAGGAAAAGTGATGAEGSTALGTGITASAAEGGLSAGLGTTTAGTGLTATTAGSGSAIGLGGAAGTGLTAAGLSGGASGGAAAGGAATGGATTGAYQVPWKNLGGALLEYMGQREAGKTAEDLLQMQMGSDQWRGQQGRYFEPIYEAATKGIGDTPYGRSLAEQTGRQSAAQGYNMSGNMLTDIAKSLNTGSMDYVRTLTPLATGRGESQAPSQFAGPLGQAAQAPYAVGGYVLDQILKGQQPTTGQQVQGTPKNQTLSDLFL